MSSKILGALIGLPEGMATLDKEPAWETRRRDSLQDLRLENNERFNPLSILRDKRILDAEVRANYGATHLWADMVQAHQGNLRELGRASSSDPEEIERLKEICRVSKKNLRDFQQGNEAL